MRTLRSLPVLLLATALGWLAPHPTGQDPQKQDPQQQGPAEAKAAAEEPAKEVIGKPKRHELEGVFRLRKRVVNGAESKRPSQGYLAITHRHLFLNLTMPGPEPGLPLVHAAVREWQETAGNLRTTAKIDYFSDQNGKIHLVPEGKREARTLVRTVGGLRIMQGRHSYLEFVRVE